ncbi:cytochrome c5 [Hymenobacter luteus]|uniref:Cytochrome c5 n=2 Tax=Hymenobacter TaxID=89966 RepID=A0A7W9SXD8_9BACT|nr:MULTISPECIES: cytochrome c [Hymenobacter]MBB4600029.1 cytochrome c5 [Hymenobacter latericoloratus]MBB6057661.1 cytochrome c5 [Hymenobacter luteus]
MTKISTVLCLLLSFMLGSCAYDKADEIAEPKVPCTTPAVVSYSVSISPLLDKNCRSCHNPALLTGSVNLEDFSVIQKYIRSGELMGNVKHLPGYNPMPQGGTKLSDCDIELLQKWVDAGAPNN